MKLVVKVLSFLAFLSYINAKLSSFLKDDPPTQQPVRTGIPPDAKGKFKLPENLSDAN